MVLAQAIWILTIPPFRGIDEFDHAFRAAGVAGGQWRASEVAENGRGMVVEVPQGLVDAASAQCQWLEYTGQDNCHPIRELGGGMVTVASSAGLYNPAWYAVVGVPTLVLDGTSALYGMRMLTALICAVTVAAAAWSLGLTRPGRWTRFAFVASLTPVLVYSTILPGPNGPEIAAGILLWAAFLALFSRMHHGRDSVLLLLATMAAAGMAVMRTIGPMWLGLITLSVVAVVGLQRVAEVVRARPLRWAIASGVVTATVAWGAWWSFNAGLTAESPDLVPGVEQEFSLGTKPLAWTLQMVAAFPLRRETAHPVVYFSASLVILFLLVGGIVKARGRDKLVLVALVFLTVLIPIVMTVLTVSTQGLIWQGRYALPWAVGIMIVAGIHLDRGEFLAAERGRPILLAGLLLATAQAASVWGVAHGEISRASSAFDDSWITLPPVLLGLLGFLVWFGWSALSAGIQSAAEAGNSGRSSPEDRAHGLPPSESELRPS